MAMSTGQLEQILEKLQALKATLAQRQPARDEPIPMSDPVVDMANRCEFPLPARLTGRTLDEEVDRKIANVMVLVERARQHEALPAEMRDAADQENSLLVEDYKDGGVADDES